MCDQDVGVTGYGRVQLLPFSVSGYSESPSYERVVSEPHSLNPSIVTDSLRSSVALISLLRHLSGSAETAKRPALVRAADRRDRLK
jgi:hypothetical protein